MVLTVRGSGFESFRLHRSERTALCVRDRPGSLLVPPGGGHVNLPWAGQLHVRPCVGRPRPTASQASRICTPLVRPLRRGDGRRELTGGDSLFMPGGYRVAVAVRDQLGMVTMGLTTAPL